MLLTRSRMSILAETLPTPSSGGQFRRHRARVGVASHGDVGALDSGAYPHSASIVSGLAKT